MDPGTSKNVNPSNSQFQKKCPKIIFYLCYKSKIKENRLLLNIIERYFEKHTQPLAAMSIKASFVNIKSWTNLWLSETGKKIQVKIFFYKATTLHTNNSANKRKMCVLIVKALILY